MYLCMYVLYALLCIYIESVLPDIVIVLLVHAVVGQMHTIVLDIPITLVVLHCRKP